MIKKYFSNIEKGQLLHMVVDTAKSSQGREDFIEAHNYIQCSILNMKKGRTFKPHKHTYRKRTHEFAIAQESWIILSGKVKFIMYELDNSILATEIMTPGMVSFTLHSGHNYEILEDNTVVLEYKTGPYEGVLLDKVYI